MTSKTILENRILEQIVDLKDVDSDLPTASIYELARTLIRFYFLLSPNATYEDIKANFKLKNSTNVTVSVSSDSVSIYQTVTVSKEGLEVTYRLEGYKPIMPDENIEFRVTKFKIKDVKGNTISSEFFDNGNNALEIDIDGHHYDSPLLTPRDKEELLGNKRFSFRNLIVGTNLYLTRETLMRHLYEVLRTMDPLENTAKNLAPKYLLGKK